jgi:hypothetical protein
VEPRRPVRLAHARYVPSTDVAAVTVSFGLTLPMVSAAQIDQLWR